MALGHVRDFGAVGRGFSIIDSSICVAMIPACGTRGDDAADDVLLDGGDFLGRQFDARSPRATMMASAACKNAVELLNGLGFSSLAMNPGFAAVGLRRDAEPGARLSAVRTKETAMASTPFLSANSRSSVSFLGERRHAHRNGRAG